MIQLLLTFSIGLFSAFALAGGSGELSSDAIYYTGQQPVGIAGDEVDCYVEAIYSADGNDVALRALIADAHDSSALIGKGTIEAQYSSAKGGYHFSTTDSDAPVQDLILTAKAQKTAEGMGITFSDEGHFDTVSCNNLTEAKDVELSEVMEKFEHFDDYVEEENADDEHHDHDDHHDH